MSRHASRTITWNAPANGMASSAATKPPNSPPTQSPSEAATSTETSTSSGEMRTVLDMMTGLSMWFSSCV